MKTVVHVLSIGSVAPSGVTYDIDIRRSEKLRDVALGMESILVSLFRSRAEELVRRIASL
jgi:hypothetical protein